MSAASIPAELRLHAPAIAGSATAILRALIALIAHALLRNPRHIKRIGPLCTYINRTMQRFQRLLAHLAAGHPPRPRRRATKARPRPYTPSNVPTTHAWLIRAIPNEAACFAGQFQTLLDQPETRALLAQAPTAGRLLRRLTRLLGLPDPCPRAATPARPNPPRTPRAHPAPPPNPTPALPRTRWTFGPAPRRKSA